MLKRIFGVVCTALFTLGAAAAAATVRTTFDGAKTIAEHSWTLKELNTSLPADWSGYNFLVMEFRASSPQRFRLVIRTTNGPAAVMFHPYPNTWVRAAIPLRYFLKVSTEGTDMASVSNRSHPGYFISLWGPHRSLESVEGIGVSMEAPIGNPSLEIRSVTLAKESPGDAVLTDHPLVDEFGQWIGANWPGKAGSLEELRKAWAQDAESLGAGGFDYCDYGGYKHTSARATGFFRVEQIGGKWWFVDPDGHLFFSTGANATNPGMATPTEGRANVFAALPPAEISASARRSGSSKSASFLTWNLQRRFGDGWPAKWVDMTIRRMHAWGMNTVANWSDPRLWASGRIPYTVNLNGWRTKVSYMGMPDVYSDEFAANCDRAAAQQCAPHAKDPMLVGYFTANEPPWPGRESELVDMILAGPDTATRRELQTWLKAGDTPERRKSFVYHAYEKYLEIIVAAVKKHDPNHLNLGMRFAGHAPDEMVKASRVFDVYSLNSYTEAPSREMLDHIYELTGRPLLIGEFHFGTPGRGLSAGLVQVRDDRERGVAYRYYVENAAAMPALIGAHWFEWSDEPATGRGDGENYNIGLVDVTDLPYRDFIAGVIDTHKALFAVHSGKQPPTTQKAVVH